jgi:HPt (histidine-containing phosphotransfer) domain-containing protein
VWLLEGLLAAKDARAGQPERALEVESVIANLRKLQEQTKCENHQASIMLLEAELARSRGEIERASGLYGRATHEAKRRELVHIAGYALEQRAEMCEQADLPDDAALFYREALFAYRRWMHNTKVRQLEAAHPELRALEAVRGDTARTGARHLLTGTRTGTAPDQGSINESLDLATVLKISQEISTQLHADGVVRSVLAGIAQNAGAERALFIVRDASGQEIVHGEFQQTGYTALQRPVSEYGELPLSVLRIARRTQRAVIVSDAYSDPSHASDPFVSENRCRSVAVVPILRKGAMAGCVVLENRLAAGAFTASVVGLIQTLIAQAAISLDNASLYENMESRIRDRTAALDARNAEMRMVLDNVSQGLITVDRAGRLSSEGSAIFGQWFAGEVPETLHALFANDAMFPINWDQLVEGVLPRELCVDQLPKRLRRGAQIFEIDWQPIADATGELVRMLVVLSDITEARRRQAAEQEQKQIMALFEHLSEDHGGVVEFTREASRLVSELENDTCTPEVEKRLLHTLKGNSALFGQTGLSTLCDEVESAIALDERRLSRAERTEIAVAWRAIHARIARFIDVSGGFVQVRRPDFEVALRTLEREGHPVALDLALWRLEALETRFQRIADQAQSLAQRLGKAPVRVYIEHSNIRIHAERSAPLWASFVHAIRNAVDHGLESPAERTALGKGPGTLRLRAFFNGARFAIELSDDGRGINWDKVRDKARAAGLPSETHEELLAALLTDGVTTRDAVSDVSGRGVGMGALTAACAAMDGQVSVESIAGRGTTWRFEFPSHVAKAPRERRASMIPSAHPAE